MSSDYTIYARGEAPGIRAFVERALGVQLCAPEDGTVEGVLHSEWMQVPITFEYSHDMLDDMGIAFSAYPVAVGFSRSGLQDDGDIREELCRSLALLLGRQLHREACTANVVVKDSQRILERNPSE